MVTLGWLVAAPTAVIGAGWRLFLGVRFGQSGKAWASPAPGLKLGQALGTRVAVTPVTPLSVATQFENGLALGAALNAGP